ncbi:MAG: glycosyltransferase family 2 protein [Longimicrobiales bacterium]|nr:glycosyltransferase family 2 protein [Longimicrobiales bacterium]
MSGTRSDAADAAHVLSARARRDFCLLIPAYNEAEMVPELLRAVREAFSRYALEGEVLLVDDGSSDGTGELAVRLGAGWPNLTVLRHRTNLGKTEAILTGAAHTDRGVIVLFDADLQHLPDEVPRFLARLEEGWDVVTGRKVGRYEKRGVSRVYNWLSRRVFDVPVSDLNSMKAFRREILDGMHLRHDWHRFFVVLAHNRGWRVSELDIDLYPRRAGTSKFTGPWRVLVGVLDLLSVGFLLRFSRKPLLLFGSLGAASLGAGTLVGLVALYVRFAVGVGFRPVLYLVILLVTLGALLLGVGFLAELVAQLREEVDALRRREGGLVLRAAEPAEAGETGLDAHPPGGTRTPAAGGSRAGGAGAT